MENVINISNQDDNNELLVKKVNSLENNGYIKGTDTSYLGRKTMMRVYQITKEYGSVIGATTGGLPNYNNTNLVSFKNDGYHVPGEEEWAVTNKMYRANTAFGSYSINDEIDESTYNSLLVSGKRNFDLVAATFDQASTTLTSNDIAAAAEEYGFCSSFDSSNCTVTLYVNWNVNILYYLYNTNGGTVGATAPSANNTYSNNSEGFVTYAQDKTGYHKAGDLAWYFASYVDTVTPVRYDGAWFRIGRTGTWTVDSGKEWLAKNESTGSLTAVAQATAISATELASYYGCDLSKTSCNIVLYVNWNPHTLYIKYNGNGGTWASTNSSLAADDDGYVYKVADGSRYIQTVVNNSGNTAVIDSSGGLSNYNNSGYINFTKTGYTVTSGAEWYALNGSTKTTFNHANTNLTAYTVAQGGGCDLSTTDCIVTLYVNWVAESEDLYCELKINSTSPDDSDSIVWKTKTPSTISQYQIDSTSTAPSTYTSNNSLSLGSNGTGKGNRKYYGHLKSGTKTYTCCLAVGKRCYGASAIVYHTGTCTCTDDELKDHTLTVSSTTYGNCNAYCKSLGGGYIRGIGELNPITTWSKCGGGYTMYKCPNDGCWSSAQSTCYRYISVGDMTACPSAYTDYIYYSKDSC